MRVLSLNDFKEKVQAGFDNNEESLARFGKTYSTQLKAYLLETNCREPSQVGCPRGRWIPLNSSGWYVNDSKESPEESDTLFMNWTGTRVIGVYSLLDALESDYIVDNWVKGRTGLDYCWLTRGLLYHWLRKDNWEERGLGLKFNDGLMPEEFSGNFSLKAWYGVNEDLGDLRKILELAKETFAITSIRWQKKSAGDVVISAEWYSNGKVTFNRASDVDDVLSTVREMAVRYEDNLALADRLRESKMAAFEIGFSRKIDLDRFSEVVSKGTGEMRLWLIEKESDRDFKRFSGIDLHTWNRIIMDVGTDYAFLTIPSKGCVNAAPRIATIQGEDNAGKTSVLFDGVDIFAGD